MIIDPSVPFPLAYLDWAKEEMGAKSVEETERHDWVMKFGQLYTDVGGNVNAQDLWIAKGMK